MYRTIALIIALFITPTILAKNMDKKNHSKQGIQSISPIVKKSIKSIVNLLVHGEIPLLITDSNDKNATPELSRKFEGNGSGVIVNAEKGYVLTNSHIIKHAKKIFITLHDGSKVLATIVGFDHATDIAVLKIPPQKIESIAIGNSDGIEIGDFVAAIGNPFSLGIASGSNQTVTFGIVSALNRSQLPRSNGYYDFIQTDAAINLGSSGGALINMKGELIGISTALLVPAGAAAGNVGVSFSIPINMAKSIMTQLIKYGSIKRGFLGALVQNFTPELSDMFNVTTQKGAIITQVNIGSPAEKTGLKTGDIITKIDIDEINDSSQVRNIVGLKRIGSTIKVQLIRDGKPLTFNVTITELGDDYTGDVSKNVYLTGLQMQDIAEHFPVHGLIKGIQVRALKSTTSAYSGGLRPGDIIVEANHKSVDNMVELKSIANDSKDNLLLRVIRGQSSFYAILKREFSIKAKS